MTVLDMVRKERREQQERLESVVVTILVCLVISYIGAHVFVAYMLGRW